MSQAYLGAFSMSANQLNIQSAMFTIHKDLPYGVWFHQPESLREKARKPRAVINPHEKGDKEEDD